ncbi:MAG: transglutaminase-like domain-containing protein [Prevotellaceae bacterium]|nr:transglutaminase-like domain-containing protein [Prevotellaceae bacterium]
MKANIWLTSFVLMGASLTATAQTKYVTQPTKYVMQPTDKQYSWEADLHHRLLNDFSKTREQVKEYIRKYIPDVTDRQLDEWEKTGELECRVIDGEKKYFHNAAPNLFRINKECARLKAKRDTPGRDGEVTVREDNTRAVMKQAAKSKERIGDPKHFRIRYTITVKPDAVPEGETVRCWMPMPRTDVPRQKNVKLLSTSQPDFVRSPMDYAHSTVYMEKKAEAGKPTVFSEEFEFDAYGAWFDLDTAATTTYDTTSDLYKTYTSERDCHMVFTPQIRALAERLTQGAATPLAKARRIFKWVDDNFPWASAREYSTIENIPAYVLDNHHGDCGQVTLLFLTLCRSLGIPAHFQSGFMLHPGEENLHDWGEIYVPEHGWVPVDQSFGIPAYAKNEQETYFFFGGIDSFRMIVNNDYGCPLYPAKQFPRSETVDFQRGEVEWAGGNLYFDQWRWKLEVVK